MWFSDEIDYPRYAHLQSKCCLLDLDREGLLVHSFSGRKLKLMILFVSWERHLIIILMKKPDYHTTKKRSSSYSHLVFYLIILGDVHGKIFIWCWGQSCVERRKFNLRIILLPILKEDFEEMSWSQSLSLRIPSHKEIFANVHHEEINELS